MKKIKRLAEWIQSSSLENRDAVIDATAQTHRYFSSIVFVVFLCYFLLISATDYALWGRWNKQHLYDFIIAGAAAVNWFVFSKPRIPRKKLLIAGDCSVLIMLILLAAGRSLGGGYVSYTLAVCTTTATIVLVLNPLHYSLLALIAMLCEILFNYRFLGGGFVTALYYGVDAFVIFAVTSCLNLFFSLLRYQLFDEASALRRENSVDALTGLYNRKYFEHYFRFHHRRDELSALIHMDLDNFKTVNDTLGHKEGDQLLVDVAEILRGNFRKSDCVARVGGDEFMVFMPALSEVRHAHEKIRSLLGKFPVMVRGEGGAQPVPVSISIGVVFSGENESPSYLQLYEKADAAMYQAKKAGKGKAVFANTEGGEVTVMQFEQP